MVKVQDYQSTGKDDLDIEENRIDTDEQEKNAQEKDGQDGHLPERDEMDARSLNREKNDNCFGQVIICRSWKGLLVVAVICALVIVATLLLVLPENTVAENTTPENNISAESGTIKDGPSTSVPAVPVDSGSGVSEVEVNDGQISPVGGGARIGDSEDSDVVGINDNQGTSQTDNGNTPSDTTSETKQGTAISDENGTEQTGLDDSALDTQAGTDPSFPNAEDTINVDVDENGASEITDQANNDGNGMDTKKDESDSMANSDSETNEGDGIIDDTSGNMPQENFDPAGDAAIEVEDETEVSTQDTTAPVDGDNSGQPIAVPQDEADTASNFGGDVIEGSESEGSTDFAEDTGADQEAALAAAASEEAAKKAADIYNAIMTVSGSDALQKSDSPQSKAAKWIIEEDLRGVTIIEDEGVSKAKVIQRYSMAVFYFSLGGESWLEADEDDEHEGDAWLSSSQECLWQGVACNSRRKVNDITLIRLGLDGTIPQEITALKRLKTLDLQKNSISGVLPGYIGSLRRLQHLDLSANELENEIPEEWYDLERLEYLYLTRNNITGLISTNIGKLTSLVDLRLEENNLGGSISDEITNLSNLRYLVLRQNNLTGRIPNSIDKLDELFYLDVSMNSLTGSIPSDLASLPSLQHIYLDGNRLQKDIPSEFGNFGQNLYSLYLQDNDLTGKIPEQFGNLVKLNSLLLQNNNFDKRIPDDVCDLIATSKGDPKELVELEADCDICTCDQLCTMCADK